MQIPGDKFLEALWRKHHGRKFTVLCGGGFGDNGKGAIESALMPYFGASVRVSGGANTGRTAYVQTAGGPRKIIFHLVPAGWAYGQLAIIGDWVEVDLDRLICEIDEVKKLIGNPKQPFYISKKAPVFLIYHAWLEAWLEKIKGNNKVGTTGRGIAPMIAGVDLRIAPLVGNLAYPDNLKRWVNEFYRAFEPIFKKMAGQGLIQLKGHSPRQETERLLAGYEEIKKYVTDVDPILHDLVKKNTATLFGLTQGFGLHFKGTYPCNSATHSIAPAAAYCSGLPTKYFGSVIQVEKLLPTRVGSGPFPTGWWDRQAALKFPKKHPELFSELPECKPSVREEFLKHKLALINRGNATDLDFAQYFMVLGNELGATTRRGREVGAPDLHMIASAAMVNGADCLALTRVDLLSGLSFSLPLGMRYSLGRKVIRPPVIPNPIEALEQIQVGYVNFPLNFCDEQIGGRDDFESLPNDLKSLIGFFSTYAGAPVGIISTSPKTDGKIFLQHD